MMRWLVASFVLVAAAQANSFVSKYEQALVAGQPASAERIAQQAAAGGDNAARFAAALAGVFRTMDEAAFVARRHGLKESGLVQLPLQLPSVLFENPSESPAPTRYSDVRGGLELLLQRVKAVDAQLAQIDGAFRLDLSLLQAAIDFDRSGDIQAEERFPAWSPWFLPDAVAEAGKDTKVSFDRADAEWLRGQTQLWLGVLETVLAHDFETLFDHGAHLMVAKPMTAYPFLAEGEAPVGGLLDQIVSLHALRFPVVAPERMRQARTHFEQVVRCQQAMWERTLAETDDTNEWQPGPQQTGFVGGLDISTEELKQWQRSLDELRLILEGKRLLPFWRGSPALTKGVNLRKVFDQPETFDVFFWVQGPGAVQYLEEGSVAEFEAWRDLEALLAGSLFSEAFALR